MTPREQAWLTLTLASGLGPLLTRRCLDVLGSPEAVATATVAQLQSIQGVGENRAAALRAALDEVRQRDLVARELDALAHANARLLTLDSPGYPRLLKLIGDPPPVLFVQGELTEQDTVGLAIVGARKCTHYGREQADRLAAGCAQAGLSIISGGAYGIDAAAHRATLRAGGRTVAVIGSGLARPYPAEHAELFHDIANHGGAVVSELPMLTPPRAQNFPSRNRIISGLALGVLVIEAANRSGALITARLAAEDHGREVLALPGRVDSAASAGCHRILREGWATLVTSVSEVLEALGEAGQTLREAAPPSLFAEAKAADASAPPVPLNASQQRVWDALSSPRTLDQLVQQLGQPAGALQAELTMLEIRGLIRRDGASQFSRRAKSKTSS